MAIQEFRLKQLIMTSIVFFFFETYNPKQRGLLDQHYEILEVYC